MKNKKIRAVILSVVGCMLFSITAFANSTTENYETMYVTAKIGLNLRPEPNTDCERITAVPYNTELKIKKESIKDDTEWYVGYNDEYEFYVNKNYLSFDKQEEVKEQVVSTSNNVTSNSKGSYLGKYKITHYCPCSYCCGWSTGITASGTKATAGRTVGCNSLPLGTKVMINGNVYTVEDTGGMSSNVIDIFCNSHQEALNKGTYYTDVYLVN